jgi:phosphoribosylpyrophosphate synthetase
MRGARCIRRNTLRYCALHTLIAKKLDIVSAAPLFAEAIRRIHSDGSLVELLEG